MKVKEAINIFSRFLNRNWDIIYPLLYDNLYCNQEDFMNDWVQVNWELLVERNVLNINEFLEAYGEGADFYSDSSRMTDIKSQPTHFIKVIIPKAIDILNNLEIKNKEYKFDRLTGFKNNFYINQPPFDYVCIDDMGIERVFNLAQVNFEIQETKKNKL